MSNQTTDSYQNPFYGQDGRALVPPAEQPWRPALEQETAQETVWLNPTETDVILDLHVGTTPARSPQAKEARKALPLPQQKELRTGKRRFIIRAGQRRSISSDFDMAIQMTHCQETECMSRPLYCRNPTHHKQVVGGLGPQLVNEAVQYRPTVHPVLIEEYAREQEALKQAAAAIEQKRVADAALTVASAEMAKAQAIQQANKAAQEKADIERQQAAKSAEKQTHKEK